MADSNWVCSPLGSAADASATADTETVSVVAVPNEVEPLLQFLMVNPVLAVGDGPNIKLLIECPMLFTD